MLGDRTYRFERLLNLTIQRARFDGNDLRRRVRVMRNGAAALAAEDSMNGFPAGAFAGPGFGGAVDCECCFGDDGDQCYIRIC